MTELALSDVVARTGQILSADTGEEILAIDEASGSCFAISGSGRLIWECTAEPISVATICERLGQRYRIDAATCARETLAFVGQLLTERLLQLEPASRP